MARIAHRIREVIVTAFAMETVPIP